MARSSKWGNEYRYRFYSGRLEITQNSTGKTYFTDGEEAELFVDNAMYFENDSDLDLACSRFFQGEDE